MQLISATLKLVAVDGARTSVSLASLQVGVNTSVQVQAVAAAGAGPLSKPVFAMLRLQQQQTSRESPVHKQRYLMRQYDIHIFYKAIFREYRTKQTKATETNK